MTTVSLERITKKTIGEILVERDAITQEQCDEALAYAKEHGGRLGEALIGTGAISRDHLYWALGAQFGLMQVEIEPDMLDHDLIRRFPPEVLRQHCMLPLIEVGDDLVAVVADPVAAEGIQALHSLCPNRRITVQLASKEQIRHALDTVCPPTRRVDSARKSEDLAECAQAPEPAVIDSYEGLRWLFAKAAEADGDLWLKVQGKKATISLTTQTGSETILDISPARFERMWGLIQESTVALTPPCPGARVWSEEIAYGAAAYRPLTRQFHSLGAKAIRARPLRIVSAAEGAPSEYDLPPSTQSVIDAALESANDKTVLIVAEGAVDGNSLLCHYLIGLSRIASGVLFLASSTRFALAEAMQYPPDAALEALARLTDVSHVAFDTPVSVQDYLALQNAESPRPRITSLCRLEAQGPEARLPDSFLKILEEDGDVVVLHARPDGAELLDRATALSSLAQGKE